MKTVKQVASLLVRRGGQRINDVVVKSCGISEDGNWFILHLNQEVPMMVQKENEDGVIEFERGVGNTLFVTPISVSAVLGNNAELSNLRSLLLGDDENMRDLFSYATIDVIQEPVKAEDEYVSPWNDDAEARIIEHDSYFTHLLDIQPGDTGWELIDTLKDVKNEFRKEQAMALLKERASSRNRSTRGTSRRPRRSVAVEDDFDNTEEDAEETTEA